eukprot:scaffold29747_cov107-Isochrysis_galbana.AAC.5
MASRAALAEGLRDVPVPDTTRQREACRVGEVERRHHVHQQLRGQIPELARLEECFGDLGAAAEARHGRGQRRAHTDAKARKI